MWVKPLAIGRDLTAWWLAATACLTSLAAFVYFDHQGVVLAYQDAVSHMEIARRVVDSPTSGLGQLGGVWLPLPHLLMLPFVWSDALYYNGIAGSAVSMASYVVCSVLLYKIVLELTNRRLAAVVGALAFMANPDVLYMQSTPMTEPLLFACMAGMVYGVQRWLRTDNYHYLLIAGIAAALGTLTRYEAWVLLFALTVVVVVAAWRKGYDRLKIEGVVLAFVFVAGVGIVSWLVWNQLIFGNALNFQTGKYAKPSLWVGSNDVAVGHWLLSLKAYAIAVLDNLRPASIAVAGAGLVVLVRLGVRALPTLSLLVLFPFFVYALENGQRPLHVSQVNGDLYNVRFGLLMVVPAAILAGCAAAALQRGRWLKLLPAAGIVAATIVVAGWSFADSNDRIVALHEPLRWEQGGSTAELTAAQFLHQRYTGGKILAQFFGNEAVLFTARISLVHNVYEGSYRQWQPALSDPAGHDIRWIVMHRTDSSDEVTIHLSHSPALRSFHSVYTNAEYTIYERA